MKKTGHTNCWWGGGEIGIFIHCLWKCEMVHSLWKTFWQSLKKSDMWDWLSVQPKPEASRTSGTATESAGDTLWPSETHYCSPCPGLPPTLPLPETLVSRAHCLPCVREGLEPPEGWVGNQEPPEASVLMSSLLNCVSGVHLRSLLGQPWYTQKLNKGSTAHILLENFHHICSELTK